MKKTAIILALALGFSISNVNASNQLLTSEITETIGQSTKISPICKAVATGNTEEVKRLLNNGVDVNAKSNGMMPIHYAAMHNRVELIKVLISAGSKIHHACDKGYTAMQHAERTNAVEASEFLKRFNNKNVWK
ncbi:ankyrin repeat domain-containing protein [Winogradskyella bathintestinalis]|uniref:Ankyrin repeat domain-containing protein n=1 Tax=Winogradskyella bathintestinalis TaxID=3035208 RepID=A0ABT7ZVD8_9FLAO|nr:ankyrin repeat domain-containing protein [Winogradskyella bathintestinalis]MDN3492911.1 ankyrin repeat domain-containing protein [Winogradskyella bathintestinalis]